MIARFADTSSLEAEIDSRVFNLYGLTPAERAIVLEKGEVRSRLACIQGNQCVLNLLTYSYK